MKKYLYLLVILIATLGLFVPKMRAQSPRAMTIVPPTVEKTLDPGQTAEGEMKVINDSNEPLTFSASVQDFMVTDKEGTPNLLPPNTLSRRFSAASWLGITPGSFTIEPHQKQTLNFYLQIPADAAPGGHYAAVAFTPVDNSVVAGTGATVQTQIGTLFYITVNGPIKEQSLISKFFANPFSEYGPVKILTQIKNLGDLHVRPIGYVTISDIFGRTIQTEKLPEFNVFPTAARDFENTMGGKLMVGRFKANLLASYGRDNNLPLVASVYFWVFPWKVSLVLILAIAAAILGWKYWKKQSAITQKDTEKKTD